MGPRQEGDIVMTDNRTLLMNDVTPLTGASEALLRNGTATI